MRRRWFLWGVVEPTREPSEYRLVQRGKAKAAKEDPRLPHRTLPEWKAKGGDNRDPG